ncbi:MAG: hypothetical protein KGS61_11170 [Verrucomicrobia bacterium]|nr:hypothetical protein [Verrucomicrobiota bacterium]
MNLFDRYLRPFRRRKGRVAMICGALAILFATVAAVQHWFVHRQVALTLTRQLRAWADKVADEIYRGDRWQVKEYRQAAIDVPGWIIVDTNGSLIDSQTDMVWTAWPNACRCGRNASPSGKPGRANRRCGRWRIWPGCFIAR